MQKNIDALLEHSRELKSGTSWTVVHSQLPVQARPAGALPSEIISIKPGLPVCQNIPFSTTVLQHHSSSSPSSTRKHPLVPSSQCTSRYLTITSNTKLSRCMVLRMLLPSWVGSFSCPKVSSHIICIIQRYSLEPLSFPH